MTTIVSFTHRQKEPAVGEVDQRILTAINRFRYLTAAQLSRLLYPRLHDENRYAQRRLHRLADLGHVQRLRALPTPRYGRAPHVFTLSRAGQRYVERMGVETRPYYRPSEEERKAWNDPFMQHTLSAIDFLIAAERLTATQPDISLNQLRTSQELKHTTVSVTVPPAPGRSESARQTKVIPDGFVQFLVANTHPVSISLELDRGTEEMKAWRRKVGAILAWASGPYRAAFDAEELTVAVIVPTERRLGQLLAWTTAELRHRQLLDTDLASIFLFIAADPAMLAPDELFTLPRWLDVHGTDTVALIESIHSSSTADVSSSTPRPSVS